MAACQAVFGTHELVEAILVELPPFDVLNAVDVCTTWREVVRQARILPSTEAISPLPAFNFYTESFSLYERGANLTLNPALPQQDYGPGGIEPSIAGPVPFRNHNFTFSSLQDCRDLRNAGPRQFATLPPVMTIRFKYYTKKCRHRLASRDYIEAAFYVKGGVRLGDIEAVVWKVLESGGIKVVATVSTTLGAWQA